MNPTVVAHLLRNLDLGGAECLTADICTRLQACNTHRPHVIAWRYGGPIAERLEQAEVPHTIITQKRRRWWSGPLALTDFFAILRRLSGLLRQEDAQLLHAHLTESTIVAALLNRRCGIPCIATVHSTRPLPSAIADGSLAYRMRAWLLKRAFRRCERIVAVSPTVAQVLRDEFAVDEERLVVILNGVTIPPPPEENGDTRKEMGIPTDHQVLVFVGS